MTKNLLHRCASVLVAVAAPRLPASIACVAFAACSASSVSLALDASFASSAPSAPSASSAPSAFAAASARAGDLDAAWLGGWMGSVKAPSGGRDGALEMPVSIDIRKGIDAATPRITVTILRAGALEANARDIVADGRSLAFTLESQGRRARFEATLGEGEPARACAGSFAFIMPDGTLSAPAFVWTMSRVDRVADLPDARVYTATLDALGQKLPMRLGLAEGQFGWCGSFDIPAQGVLGLAVAVERTDAGFRVTLPVQTIATIELEADAERKVLTGLFAQAGFRGPIRFEFDPAARLGNARRPQDPKPPFPYVDADVVIEHPAGHALAGTLSMPAPEAARALVGDAAVARGVPAVVLVSGSGPQNRDEELLGHRPFAVIADALARAGFAVLRYDDRGVGASTGRYAGTTTLDFASDADIATEWLKRQPGIDPSKVGLLGHSEGAVIAPFVAVWQQEAARTEAARTEAARAEGAAATPPLAFTVLLAPPAETGGETLTRQTARMYELTKLEPGAAARAVAAHEAVMQAVAAFADAQALRPRVDVLVRAQLAMQTTGLPPASELDRAVDGALAQITDPWMTEFIRLDPRVALARLGTPTLAVWGSKDFQVVAEPNRAKLDALVAERALPVATRVYDGLNHLFQPAGTGLIDEYGTIDTTFDPAALADVVAWMKEQVAPGAGRAAPAAAPGTANPELPGEMPRRIWTSAPPNVTAPGDIRSATTTTTTGNKNTPQEPAK